MGCVESLSDFFPTSGRCDDSAKVRKVKFAGHFNSRWESHNIHAHAFLAGVHRDNGAPRLERHDRRQRLHPHALCLQPWAKQIIS